MLRFINNRLRAVLAATLVVLLSGCFFSPRLESIQIIEPSGLGVGKRHVLQVVSPKDIKIAYETSPYCRFQRSSFRVFLEQETDPSPPYFGRPIRRNITDSFVRIENSYTMLATAYDFRAGIVELHAQGRYSWLCSGQVSATRTLNVCVPKTCGQFICGQFDDGCGGVLNCGDCLQNTCDTGEEMEGYFSRFYGADGPRDIWKAAKCGDLPVTYYYKSAHEECNDSSTLHHTFVIADHERRILVGQTPSLRDITDIDLIPRCRLPAVLNNCRCE